MEKRFTLAYEKGNWWAVRDYDITLWKEEVICLMNELYEENERLNLELDKELEDKDIVCIAGKFRLEEWGKHRYHQFYKEDEEIEDETVVIMLMELSRENEKLKDALWEANVDYIEEKNDFSIDIEKDIDFLKKEFKRGYWND